MENARIDPLDLAEKFARQEGWKNIRRTPRIVRGEIPTYGFTDTVRIGRVQGGWLIFTLETWVLCPSQLGEQFAYLCEHVSNLPGDGRLLNYRGSLEVETFCQPSHGSPDLLLRNLGRLFRVELGA